MEHLEQELFDANSDTIMENIELTETQQKQVEEIISKQVGQIKEATVAQKARLDYMAGVSDPEKPDFKEMCEYGAKLVDTHPNLKSALYSAENRADFLYEIGRREAAFQATQNAQAPKQQQPMMPTPQPTASPYSATVNPANIPWGSLTDEQFIEQAAALGIRI